MQEPLSVVEKAASGSLLESEGCRGCSWMEVKLEDIDDGPPPPPL